MLVFIRNIPGDTLTNELVDFISPALKGGLFKAKGQITDLKILVLRSVNTKNVEYHAVVTIESDKAAQRAIKQLNGKRFRGKPTGVRQFFERSKDENPTHHDRRRNLELLVHYVPNYSANKKFSRVLSSKYSY